MEAKFDAIIVDSDLMARGRLYQAAHAFRGFGRVTGLSVLQEALERLYENERCDIVFISHRFEPPEVESFIGFAKETEIGQDCAFILIDKPSTEDATSLVQKIIDGIDGLLVEPFSVDSLHEIIQIASDIKKQNATKRVSAAIGLMVSTIMAEIDRKAMEKALGREPRPVSKQLEKAQDMIRQMIGDDLEMYLEIALEVLGKAEPREQITYQGASKRVRQMLERKQLEKAEREASAAVESLVEE